MRERVMTRKQAQAVETTLDCTRNYILKLIPSCISLLPLVVKLITEVFCTQAVFT